jgi:hypothetical protein
MRKIEIYHVRSGSNEGITLEQDRQVIPCVDNGYMETASSIIEVSLDGITALISALEEQRDYYRPADKGPGPDQLQFG